MMKITKARAQSIYNAGGIVILAASKMRPEYGVQVDLVSSDYASFDSLVYSFSYYNCGAETGKRVSFYTNE